MTYNLYTCKQNMTACVSVRGGPFYTGDWPGRYCPRRIFSWADIGGEYWRGDIVLGNIVIGDIDWGDIVPGDIVPGDIVLIEPF